MVRGLASASFGLALAVTGCDVLHTMHSDHTGQHGAAPSPPSATFAPAEVSLGPTSAQLAAHFCPRVAATTPLDADASAACRANGPAPALDDLATRLHVESIVESRSMVRSRIESALLVLTLYPGTGAQQVVGAVCLTFCDEGASECPQTEEACRSSAGDALDLADVAPARGFLASVAVDEQRLADLRVQELAPHGTVTLAFDVALGTQTLLDAIFASDAAGLDAIRAGQAPSFSVPYALEGTLWLDGRGNDGWAERITRATGTLDLGGDLGGHSTPRK